MSGETRLASTKGVAARESGASRLRAAAPSLLVAIPLLWLVALPLAVTLVSAFKPTGFLLDPGSSLENFRAAWGDRYMWPLALRTLVFASGSALLAIVVGTLLAFIVERGDLRGAATIRALLLLPMAIPPFLLAMSFTMLFSPRTGIVNAALTQMFGLTKPLFDIYSMTGMIFVEGLSLAPSAYLVLAPAFRNIDASLEEAALMSGAGGARTFARVVLPLLTPALAGAFVYLLIVSCMVFDVPGTIGMPAGLPVLSIHMYDLINNSPTGLPDYGGLGALAVLLIATLVALCLVYQRAMARANRFVTITGKNFQPRAFRLGRAKWACVAFIGLYLLAGVLAPLVTLLWMSFAPYVTGVTREALGLLTLANHRAFLFDPLAGKALAHSLAIALASACVLTCLALVVSWVVVRTRAPGRRALDLLSFMPLALPGVLVGTALIYVYLAIRVVPLYGTIWIIAIAHTTVYLSFASRSMNAAVTQMHPELEEAARMAGAGWAAAMRRVVAPLALPALAALWLWIFSHSLRELSASLMLQGVDNKTLPTLMFSYWSQGQSTKTAAVGVWLIAGLLALLLAGHWLQRAARAKR